LLQELWKNNRKHRFILYLKITFEGEVYLHLPNITLGFKPESFKDPFARRRTGNSYSLISLLISYRRLKTKELQGHHAASGMAVSSFPFQIPHISFVLSFSQ